MLLCLTALLGVGEGLLGHLSEIGEGLLVRVGDLGKDLAVELDASELETMRGLFCSIASCWAFRRSAVRCCAASCSGEPSSRISPTRFATSLAVSLPEPMPAKRLSVLG